MTKFTSFGAAETVTGSCHLLDVAGSRCYRKHNN